jgi:hypothetical protein
MNFNLNDNSLVTGGSKVFNNGIAGLVKDVSISVTKRSPEEPDNNPHYKLIITDSNELVINQGFFYYTDKPEKTEEENKKGAGYLIGRLLSVANSIVPEGFVYPDVSNNSVNEIVDILFKIIKENCEGKKVNVFTTYGRKTQPSQFLGLRFFDFIESANTQNSKLRPKGDDMMERMVADEPANSSEDNKTTSGGW